MYVNYYNNLKNVIEIKISSVKLNFNIISSKTDSPRINKITYVLGNQFLIYQLTKDNYYRIL